MYQEALGRGVLRMLMKSKSIRTTYFCVLCVVQYLLANPAVCHDSLEQRPDPPRPFEILGPETVMTENNDISFPTRWLFLPKHWHSPDAKEDFLLDGLSRMAVPVPGSHWRGICLLLATSTYITAICYSPDMWTRRSHARTYHLFAYIARKNHECGRRPLLPRIYHTGMSSIYE